MKNELEAAVAAACKELFQADVSVELTRPDEQFGDYATNVALQLAKQVGQDASLKLRIPGNPREIGEALAEKLRSHKALAKVEVAGPGFLNLTVHDTALLETLGARPARVLAGKTIIVEYSDTNPFKPLHAGHLYTTLVGDMIARLTEHAGAKTVRINYGGDVGLHVGKSMWAIIKHLGGEHPDKLGDIPEAERPAWLGARYVEGASAYEENEAAKQEIVATNRRVYQLHKDGDGKSAFAQIYWTCRQWSYDYFETLYNQLQVHPFDRFIPESEVTPLGLKTVQEQLEKDVYEVSDGAVIFDGEKYGLHKRVFINSEGLPTYETKDVGLSLTKWQDYKFDQSIIITAAEQQQYMEVVIKSIEQFAPEPAKRTKHLVHGTVKLAGGVKMSSRKGNVVTALEVLEAARQAGAATGTNPTEETILAAVKYAFAKNRIGGDIVYDPKESIALEGNSGPYLQYAHARAKSILRKGDPPSPHASGDQLRSDAHVPSNVRSASVLADHPKSYDAGEPQERLEPGERTLARKLGEYSEVVERATTELMPHYICTYLYELAQGFNRFYEQNRVIGDEREAVRLHLVQAYADTLKAGLELLGIHAPEKM